MGFVALGSIDVRAAAAAGRGLEKCRSLGCQHTQKEDANPELLQIDPKANGGLKREKKGEKLSFFSHLTFGISSPPCITSFRFSPLSH
jgi:hypothetical protein